MQHVEEDLVFAQPFAAGAPGPEELAPVSRVRDLYRELTPLPCTSCRYCMPCPQGVAIPEVLSSTTTRTCTRPSSAAQFVYRCSASENERADRCTACGECEDTCPQDIAVPGWMEKAQAFLASC